MGCMEMLKNFGLEIGGNEGAFTIHDDPISADKASSEGKEGQQL